MTDKEHPLYGPKSLLLAELNLLAEQGKSPQTLDRYRREIEQTPIGQLDIDRYWQQLAQLPPAADWTYVEPSDYAGILTTLPKTEALATIDPDTIFNKRIISSKGMYHIDLMPEGSDLLRQMS